MVKKEISQIIKFLTMTLCLFLVACNDTGENNPVGITCVDGEEIKSYYNPSKGTVNLHYDVLPCGSPILEGSHLNSAIVVLNDVGRYIAKINGDGSTAWIYRGSMERYVVDLKLVNGNIQFIELHDLVTVDAQTGQEKSRKHVGYVRCYDTKIVCLDDGVMILATGVKVPAIYPRDATLSNGVLYVADTFGHNVVAFDASTGIELWRKDGFYPNSVQVVNGSLLVAEEHANRIVSIDLSTLEKSMVFACEKSVFADITSTVDQIKQEQATGSLSDGDKSICAGELYSPNQARRQDDGTLLISDTDNHRVIHVSATGEIIRIVRNLNNPVNAVIIP